NIFFDIVSRISKKMDFRLKSTEKQAKKAVGKRHFPFSDLRGAKKVSRFSGIRDFRLKSSRKTAFSIFRLMTARFGSCYRLCRQYSR
ncbi:MAG: hypothetical protein IKG93_04545, partial [Clostridiales bacterium]|nr:hypothetical protein [Clostridiales bacterium]